MSWIGGPWAFNGLLAVAAGFQVWLLFRTWEQIKSQAETMKTQAEESKNSGTETLAALKRQADSLARQSEHMESQIAEARAQVAIMSEQNQTARDRERARLSISRIDKPEIQSPGDLFGERLAPIVIYAWVVNDGSSMAFNVRAWGHALISTDFKEGFSPDGYLLSIPLTIRSVGNDGIATKVAVTGGMVIIGAMEPSDFTMISEDEAIGVKEGTRYLRINGVIRYEDIFGASHETPFDYRWIVPAHDSTGLWLEGCRWIDYSDKSS